MTAAEPLPPAPAAVGAILRRQHATAWALLSLHLRDLESTEMLWRPARAGPDVHELADGSWTADWPEVETYEAGAPSIA